MGWFDQQLKYRKQKDDEIFSEAVENIAGAVMGRRLSESIDDHEISQSAIDEILKYYRIKNRFYELPPNVKTFEEQLEYRLRPFGIMTRNIVLDKEWYKCAVGPVLGSFKDDGRVVALIPGKMNGYSYYDYKSGKRVKLNKKTAALIDTEAICFYKPFPMKKLNIADLFLYMREQRSMSDTVLYFGMMAVTTLVGLVPPVFNKWLFGDVINSGSIRVLFALAGFMLSFSVCQLCINTFKNIANNRIGTKQDIAVQAAVMNRILSLPASFFKQYTSGELTQHASYIQSLCSTIMNTIGTAGLTSLFSLIYIGQIFVFARELVIPSIVITVITTAVTLLTTLIQSKVTKEKLNYASKTSGMTYSLISGIQKIKLAGAEKRMFSRWAKQYSKEAVLEYNPPLFLKISPTINLAVNLVGSIVLYYFAVRSHVSVENYYAFNASYGTISAAFVSLANIAVSLADIKPILEMSKSILEAEPEMASDKEIITSIRGGIELNNVSFRYDDSMPNVIDKLSLKIKAGEYIAIVGSTGCGKSTLMRLLLGFEKPQKGAIYYDGKDTSRIDMKSLRKKIGTVMQDGKLFPGDIYSNIVIAAPHLGLQDAWEAAEIASVDEDIKAMPMGMHTIISEGQGGISGGQKQRLMIARAVAHKPKILMFDEATSALDNITQKKVSQAINSLKCTRIVIAHRLSTIRECDRIIVLDNGKIIEEGTYDELIENNGFFAELVSRQRLDIEG